MAHALMVVLLLLSLPGLMAPNPFRLALDVLGLVCVGPPLVYALSQRHLHRDWLRRLMAFPVLALLGLGIAWENARAVWRGLTRWGGTFERTPKFQLEGRRGAWTDSRYRLDSDGGVLGEVFLALYALVAAGVAVQRGSWGMIPLLLMYAAAFGATAALQLKQSLRARRSGPARASQVPRAVGGSQRN